MTAEVTRTLALLDMLEAHIDQLIHTKQDHPQKHELLVIKQAQSRIKMGVPSVKVEALYRRELRGPGARTP